MTLNHVDQARQLEVTSRIGDLVRVRAPQGSMAERYNGHDGELVGFNPGGWVVVKLIGLGDRRFRADELQVL